LFHGRGSGGDSQPELVRDHGVIVWRVEGDRGVTPRHPAGFVLRGSWGTHVGQKDFHVMKREYGYRLLAFPIPSKSRPAL
jgi:hypothetical protein